jgi:hypothetical protein|mmetsp:Transcript_5759/g.10574  ORF Transcript_5759/g.10574 Transcript_5759/m.10574 type:complete len:201 (-) Transcript_5759:17-619(-)
MQWETATPVGFPLCMSHSAVVYYCGCFQKAASQFQGGFACRCTASAPARRCRGRLLPPVALLLLCCTTMPGRPKPQKAQRHLHTKTSTKKTVWGTGAPPNPLCPRYSQAQTQYGACAPVSWTGRILCAVLKMVWMHLDAFGRDATCVSSPSTHSEVNGSQMDGGQPANHDRTTAKEPKLHTNRAPWPTSTNQDAMKLDTK